MNIHEYQGKALLKQAGVPVLEGVHCTTVKQALEAYDKLGSKVVAVKSQIHAGGRGKGTMYNPDTREEVMQGGVKIAFSRDEVETYATNILGNLLVTIQLVMRAKSSTICMWNPVVQSRMSTILHCL